jgi:mono/diheme cytochrome c family protein
MLSCRRRGKAKFCVLEATRMPKLLTRSLCTLCVGLFLCAGWNAARTAKAAQKSQPPKATQDSQVERGRYLVEDVAMCFECHTPRRADGQLETNAWLQGAPIWIVPVHPNSNWAQHAPALAGFPSFTEEEGERVLEKGEGPEGEVLRPPMHIYHMKPEDAKAIIAYLKSLPSGQR